MSRRPITRDDAVMAARLWGLASRRYVTPSVVPLRAPEPNSLYAGFEAAGSDPVEVLTELAAEMEQLARSWRSGPGMWPVREGDRPGPRACSRSGVIAPP